MTSPKTVSVYISAESCPGYNALNNTMCSYIFNGIGKAGDLQTYLRNVYNLPESVNVIIKKRTVNLEGKSVIATLHDSAVLVDGSDLFAVLEEVKFDVISSLNPVQPVFQIEMAALPTKVESMFSEYEDNLNVEEYASENITNSSTSVLPSPLTVPVPCKNHGEFLVQLYTANFDFMNNLFISLIPDEPFIWLNKINVFQQLTMPRTKAAIVVYSHQALFNYDMKIFEFAKDYIQKAIIDLVYDARQRHFAIPSRGLRPLIEFMGTIVKSTIFTDIQKAEETIQSAVRKRIGRERKTKFLHEIPFKQAALWNLNSDSLDEVISKLNQASTSSEEETLMNASTSARCRWIISLLEKKTKLVPELVVDKFPCLVQNVALLRFDFEYMMSAYHNLPVVNVGETFQTYLPAIHCLGQHERFILPGFFNPVNCDLMEIFDVYVKLVKKYCKHGVGCSIDYIYHHSEETSFNPDTVAFVRSEKNHQAPMLFSFGQDFYITIRELFFKVEGSFCDAIQRLFEFHYVFKLSYFKATEDVFYVLENLAGLPVRRFKNSREQLFQDLNTKLSLTRLSQKFDC